MSPIQPTTNPSPISLSAIRACLRAYLVDACFGGDAPADFADSDDLIERGLMTSLTLMGLATHLEQAFGLELGGNDMVPAHFRSIDALATLVQSRIDVR